MVRLFLGRMRLALVMPLLDLGMTVRLVIVITFFVVFFVHALVKNLRLFPTVFVTGGGKGDESKSSEKSGDLHE